MAAKKKTKPKNKQQKKKEPRIKLLFKKRSEIEGDDMIILTIGATISLVITFVEILISLFFVGMPIYLFFHTNSIAAYITFGLMIFVGVFLLLVLRVVRIQVEKIKDAQQMHTVATTVMTIIAAVATVVSLVISLRGIING